MSRLETGSIHNWRSHKERQELGIYLTEDFSAHEESTEEVVQASAGYFAALDGNEEVPEEAHPSWIKGYNLALSHLNQDQ